MTHTLLQASANALPLADETVQCVVTSPPYWGLRQYAGEQRQVWGGDAAHDHDWQAQAQAQALAWATPLEQQKKRAGETYGGGASAICSCGAWYGALGLEPTPDLYVAHMVEVFREVRRVVRADGTLWLNLGDCYASGDRGGYRLDEHRWEKSELQSQRAERGGSGIPLAPNRVYQGLAPKNLVGIPWRVAFALQDDGWILRSDIIWAKPNPMPESVTDRPTKAHEYLFLFAKSERYFYDREAILEPLTESSIKRIMQETFDDQTGGEKDYAATGINVNRSQRRTLENFRDKTLSTPHAGGRRQAPEPGEAGWANAAGRNKRTVWTIPTRPYPGAHFATFPEDLVEPCIIAGSKPGDVVLDPFNGSGTTGRVAVRHGRSYVGIDISREYLEEQALGRIDPLAGAERESRMALDGRATGDTQLVMGGM